MLTKWITSMESFAPLVLPILEIVRPKLIGEIGAAEGGNTRVLYEFQKTMQGELITIDPFPRGSFLEWVRQSSDVVTHLPEYSLQCIQKAGKIDVWFIDGDHNWYTVYNELRLIDQLAQQNAMPGLIFLHDVGWPCARRDMYYNPTQIPAEFVHPYSSELGITLDKSDSIRGGFKGPNWALKEGGPKNGVLTAIEDFIQSTTTRYHWINIPAILGLGVLVDEKHPLAKLIIDFYAPYHNNPLLALMERDRITHYLALVALNDKQTNTISAV
ncbi:MAG: class I SAM-dependent methyltransferase [Gammaproteobacteria bacterium]